MIEKLDRREFDTVYTIMEQSFPLEEYRPYAAQRALLDNPTYDIYVAREKGEILGFGAAWQLEQWLFLEHLAVTPGCRNLGVGGQLLRFFAGKHCCLEVELPETEISRRRIGFYERNGFFLNGYPYMQPSLGEGRSPVPLRIMTTQGTVPPEAFTSLQKLLYSRVYGQKE